MSVLLILFVASQSSTTGRLHAAPTAPAIRLQSRTFTPIAGIDPALRLQAENQANQRNDVRWHGLIQFWSIPDADVRQQIAVLGGRLLTYVPDNAWLVSFPGSAAALTAGELPAVRWLGNLQAADKIDPAIVAGDIGPWAINQDGTIMLAVHYFEDVSVSETIERLDRLSIGIQPAAVSLFESEGYLTFAATSATIWEMATDDAIVWIAPVSSPPAALNDGARANVDADVVHSSGYGLGGNGYQIGIWDNGAIEADHPDFGGRLELETDQPVTSHATHVAGTVGGDGSNSLAQGGTQGQWRGIAPGAELFSFYYVDNTSVFDRALNELGIDVLQNSWGGGAASCASYGYYTYDARAYDRVVTGYYGRKASVVFAAGNSQQACDPGYGTILPGPQSSKNVITVGAINSDDNTMTAFSSWGPVRDGRIKPEVVAPGDESGGDQGIQSTVSGAGYGGYIGTSMAAPVVSGSIAIVLEGIESSCDRPYREPLPSTLRALLIHTARDLDDPATAWFNPGPDFASGFGRINVRDAVDAIPYHVEAEIIQDEGHSYSFTILEEEQLLVTLAWDDAPPSLGADIALVNDLDLEVVAPDGTTYGPWQLDPADPAALALQPTWVSGGEPVRDSLNVQEQIRIDAPQPGDWTAHVIGSTVPEGPQSYTIVSEALVESSCNADNAINSGGGSENDGILPTAVGLRQSSARAPQSASPGLQLLVVMCVLTFVLWRNRSSKTMR